MFKTYGYGSEESHWLVYNDETDAIASFGFTSEAAAAVYADLLNKKAAPPVDETHLGGN